MGKKAVLSLSGGMDSTSLLLKLLNEGYEVKTITIDYGQKHSIEIDRAKQLLKLLEENGLQHSHNNHFLTLPLQDLLHSSLVKGGSEVPEGHYAQENMKKTVVPNRNKIFASIIQGVALSWALETNSHVEIAMGIHNGDHTIYPDCRQEFRDADFKAFQLGNWDSHLVSLNTPFINSTKGEVLEEGLVACFELGLSHRDVYSKTWTSYKPIEINGELVSDVRSGSSVERVEAFIENGVQDPIKYGDNGRILEWWEVVEIVSEILRGKNNFL